MQRKILAGLASAGIAVGMLGGTAAPASALTASGTVECLGGGSTAGVYGQQQRLGDTLTLSVSGAVIFQQSQTLSQLSNSGIPGTQTWQAHSVSLLINESYGTCFPPAA